MDDTKNIIKKKRRCISMKNGISMERCGIYVFHTQEICGLHKKRKLLYLPNGSVWKNPLKSTKLHNCVGHRPQIKFWEILDCGVTLDKLDKFYAPDTVSRLRVEKVSYLRDTLKKLGVNSSDISESRYYWFINLLYYLGNFPYSVKKIQRFCKGPFKIKFEKRKKAVKTIWNFYLNYKLKKLLPIFIRNGGLLKIYNCINLKDPITQDTFMEVDPERWVICQYSDMKNCWWFDISSVVQLLGSPGSYSSENPFNRK